MTRRDWWLGIAVLVAALAIHAVITIMASMRVEAAIETAFTPGLKPLAALSDPPARPR